MTVARAIRLLLAFVTICIVAWSFGDVARRTFQQWHMQHERPITLEILHWGNTAEVGIVDALVKRYEAEHPNVRIIRIHTPGGSGELKDKLKTMLAAGTPPDLFYLPPDELAPLARMDLIRPIDDYIAKERRAGTGTFLDDYYPILMKAWHYDVASGAIGKGKLYGLPKDFTTAGFYVNLDLFEKAGVKVPYDGWTWDEFEQACKKITALNGQPGMGDRKIYGGYLNLWPDSWRNVLWTFGGDYFRKRPDGTDDFHDVTLDDPPAQEAMKFVTRLRLDEGTVYNPTGIAREGGQEFVNGNIGCIGPIGRWMVPTFKDITSFKWDFVPIPYKEKRFQASQLYLVAWAMTKGSKHPDEAYKLMKFLCGPEGASMQARLGLAIPPLKSVAESKDFLAPPGLPPHHSQIFLDAIKYARLQQIPPEPEWQRIVDDRIKESTQLGEKSTLQNAKEIEAAWLAVLNSPLKRKSFPPMRWDLVLWLTAAVAVTLVAALWWRSRGEKIGPLDRAQARAGWMFIMPWVIGFLALTLGPMIASLLLSFTSWSAMTPISKAQAVGLANYREMFTADDTFYQSLKVTFYFVILAVPLAQITALAVALLMNLKVRGITIFRTLYFVPTVVSGVALAVLWLQIFNNDYGVLNSLLNAVYEPAFRAINHFPRVLIVGTASLCWVAAIATFARIFRRMLSTRSREAFYKSARTAALLLLAAGIISISLTAVLGRFGYGITAPDWFGRDARIWAIPAFVIMGLWGVGGGMIIYLAGLKGIPISLYEAATIDGAGPMRKLWNVTLPMLSPLIFYNVVMGIIGSFQVFTQAYVMTGAGPGNSTLFYVLNLYRQAFEFHNMGYASAMAWVLFLIVLALTILVFRGSRNLVYYEGLKA